MWVIHGVFLQAGFELRSSSTLSQHGDLQEQQKRISLEYIAKRRYLFINKLISKITFSIDMEFIDLSIRFFSLTANVNGKGHC